MNINKVVKRFKRNIKGNVTYENVEKYIISKGEALIMLIKIFYILFVFFTQQQIYASDNFRGSAQSVGIFLGLFGSINSMLSLAALIHIAFSTSVFEALVLFVASFVSVIVLNFINIPAIFSALIGVPFNVFAVVYYILNL